MLTPDQVARLDEYEITELIAHDGKKYVLVNDSRNDSEIIWLALTDDSVYIIPVHILPAPENAP